MTGCQRPQTTRLPALPWLLIGPRVDSTVEASSRATYARALEQFLLDGTGLCLGLVVVLAGFFVRANL